MSSTRLGVREKWNLSLQLNHEGRERWDHNERLIVYKLRGESAEHVAMKVLAYLLLHQDGLQIERSAEQHYKPDVVLLDDEGQPVIWADCGSTSLRKLDRISTKNRRTVITIVKSHERELAAYKERAENVVKRHDRVRWWTFRDHFVSEVAQRLMGRHEVQASVTAGDDDVTPGHIYLAVDGEALDSPVVTLAGGQMV